MQGLFIAHHVWMKKLFLCMSLFGLISLPSTAATNDSIFLIKHQMAAEQIQRVEAYLKANPSAPDELSGLNLLIQNYQIMGRNDDIIQALIRRYEIMEPAPEGKDVVLLQKTIFPVLQALYQRNRRTRAKEFSDRVLADFKGRPLYNSIMTGIAVIEDRFRIPEIGDKPMFEFTEFFTGTKYSLADFKGSYTLIEFWTDTCDICEYERPFIKEVYENYKDKGLAVIGFSRCATEECMTSFVEKHDVTWPQCLDTLPIHKVAKKLKLVGVPFNMLLDKDGVVQAINLRGTQLLQHMEKLFVEAPSDDIIVFEE